MTWRSVLRCVWWFSLVVPLVAHAGLREDMVKFDQAYIPTLVLSGQGKSESLAAMNELLTRWDEFKQGQAYRLGRDAQWNFDLTRIEKQILEARRWLQEGDYHNAYLALKPVRATLMQMRSRIGMAYFPDALIRFHAPMEALIAEAKSLTDMSKDIGPLFGPPLAKAQKRWEAVVDLPFNPYDYELDLHRGEALRKQVLLEQADLHALGQSLAKNDRLAMAKLLTRIRAGYLTIYNSFGHFPSAVASGN